MRVGLKLDAHEGESWDFEASTKLANRITVSANGQQQQIEQAMDARRQGTMEILAVKDGNPSAIRIKFGPQCDSSQSMNGNKNDVPFPLAGKTVTVRRGDDGQISLDVNGIDPATAAEVVRMADFNSGILPPHPVAIGDEWDADARTLAKQLQLGPDDRITIKCKLLALGAVGTRKTADISTSGSATKNDRGVVTRLDLGGVNQVDLITGIVLQSDIIGKIGIKGGQDVNGPGGQPIPMQTNGQGTLEAHQTVHKSVAAVAAAGGPGPDAAPPAADRPGPLPAPAPAPLPAPEAAAPAESAAGPFVGRFKGEGLMVELHPDAGGALTGTLTLGEHKYPASAKVDGDRLVGSFESDGSHFDFTAKLDGGSMSLTSGSSRYTLKKDAPNPLDKPRRRNPLEPQAGAEPAPAPPGAPPAMAAAPAGRTLKMKRIAIRDELCKCDAATLLIPDAWTTQGGIVWRTDPYSATTMSFQAYDPKSLDAMFIYPELRFTAGAREAAGRAAAIAGPEAVAHAEAAFPDGAFYMGAEIRPPVRTPLDYVKAYFIPRFRKDLANARIGNVTDLPELASMTKANWAGVEGVTVQVSRVHFEYASGGAPTEEDVFCTLTLVPQPMIQSLAWGATTSSCRAAKGHLDEVLALSRTMESSAKLDLKWYAGVVDVQNAMQDAIRQNIYAAGKLSAMISKRNDEISEMIRSSYEKRQAVQDRVNEKWSEVIRGVESREDPFGGHPVDVPAGYNYAYTNALGEVVLSNDASFHPGQVYNGDWRAMNPRR